jgi:hypothetical protein
MNIQHVFQYYKVRYAVKGNKISYRRNMDKDMTLDYTTKANDNN